MLKHLMWVIALTTFTISSAQALVFIEPQVGYATGSFKMEYKNILDPTEDISSKPDIKGLNYGIKGGLELGSWQLGLDYMKNDLKKSGSDGDDFENDKFKTTELAAIVGYRFWFSRIYAGYIFSADVTKKNVGDVDFDSGAGFKFGASFYALKHMAINLEYRNVHFDETTSSGVDGFYNLDYSTLALLVSFPFSI